MSKTKSIVQKWNVFDDFDILMYFPWTVKSGSELKKGLAFKTQLKL